MSDVINTESKLFKMYAAHRIRKIGWGDVEEVLRRDADTINICTYGRGIAFEFGYHFMIALLKFLGGLLVTFMVLTPVLSIGFWLFTDNPFIIWFGKFGEAVMGVDAILIAVGMMFGGWWVWDEYVKPHTKSATTSMYEMSNIKVATTWIKAKHGKFCHRLSFDRPAKVEKDEYEEVEWPRE